jgi:hypothetical protein
MVRPAEEAQSVVLFLPKMPTMATPDAADRLKDKARPFVIWKLLWILADPYNHCSQGLSEVRRNMRSMSIVPANRFDEISPRSRGKENARHSSRPAT